LKAKDLRNAVLQLAVQGKLVPQNPEDEPASVLIEKIKAEKARLVKGKKIKKQKPLPVISEEEIPFEIPESWEWVRLGEIGNWSSGATPQKSNDAYYRNGTIPWLRTGDLTDDYINDIPIKITQRALNETSVKLNKPGSVLIAMYGATIGKIGILTYEATTNQACCACDLFSDTYNRYLFYFLLSQKENFKKRSEGGAQPNISKEKIVKYLFPLPPLEEQKRIVSKLEEIMPLIDEYDKLEQKLSKLEEDFPEKLKKSILQYAVQGKLIPQSPTDEPASILLEKIKTEKAQLIKDKKIKKQKPLPPITEEEKPFEIPDSWEWVRLGEISTYIQRGKSPKYSLIRKFPVISQKCNQWSGFSIEKAKFIQPETLDKYAEERFLQDGDLLWNSTGLGTLGRIVIYKTELNPYDIAVADSHVTVLRQISKYCLSRYLLFYFSNPSVQNVIEMNSEGSTKQKELSTTTIKKYIVPLPPFKEQKRIVEKIEQLIKFSVILADKEEVNKYGKESIESEEREFEYKKAEETSSIIDLKVAEDKNNDEYAHFSFAARSTKQPVMSEKMKERMKIHIKRAKEAKKLKE